MQASGVPLEEIEAARKQQISSDDDFEVWEENWRTVLFFGGLFGQWRAVAGMTKLIRTGLDYNAVESTMRMERIPLAERARLLANIRIMEYAALQVLNKI